MPYLGNVPSSFNVGTDNINNDAITTAKIADGAILNADVNAAAAIAGTKISPDFGSQTIATTGIFSHALGSVSAPTITFTGDLNTGIWSPAADTIAFSEGGVEAMRIDSSGRVGIGTTSPGNLNTTQVTSDNDGIRVQLQATPSVGQGPRLIFGHTTNNGTQQVFAAIKSLLGSGNDVTWNSDLAFYTGGSSLTERLRIDASGRLLVGTATGRTGVATFVSGSNNTNADYQGSAGSFVGPGLIGILSNAATISVEDNRPAALDVGGSIGFGGRYLSGNTDYAQMAAIAGKKETATSGEYGGYLGFYTRTHTSTLIPERGRFDSQGNFIVGKQQQDVTLKGFYVVGNNAVGNGSVFSTISSPVNTYHVYSSTTNTYRFYVNENGGISNFAANNVNLSDEREKKNITNLESTWDCLKHWELKQFHYNEDSDGDAKRYGVIAQQVAPHCPEVISDWIKQPSKDAVLDDDGNEIEPAKEAVTRLAVKEQQMYWMAIKALQEAQVRIEALEAEVAALKNS